MRRALFAFGLAVAAVLLLAVPAGAHAVLLQTEPASGQTYPTAPKVITLRFDENVQVGLGGIRLFDSSGKRIETGKPTQTSGGKTVSVSVPALKQGTFVATWRVISADGHPVQNAFTFSVGRATVVGSGATNLANQTLAGEGGSRVVGVIYGSLRFIGFVAAGILLGGFGFLLICWPNGKRSRSTLRLLRGSWLIGFVGSIAAVLFASSYTAALGPGDSFKPSVVRDYIDTHVGHVLALRILVFVVIAIVGELWLRRTKNQAATVLPAALAGIALVATFTLAGHARSGFQVPLAIATDLAHVTAFALWFGGLVVMSLSVLRPDDPSELEPAVSRFSTLALGCVAVLVGTGVYQGWRQVGTFGALKSTTYGRLLLVKLALVAVVVLVASVSRDVVRNRLRRGSEEPDELDATEADAAREPLPVGPGAARADEDRARRSDVARRLRIGVAIEVVFLVAVLATTALLVDAAPARTAVNAPFSTTIQAKNLNFELLLVPARTGPNELHVTATQESGLLAPLLGLDVELANPAKNIAPIKVNLIRLGPGHYTSNSLVIPFSGTWQLSIKALVTQIDEVDASTAFRVRS